MSRRLTVTTPYGTFSRRTNTDYRFVALAAHSDGSPVRVVGAAARGGGVPYLPRWSRTAEGAVKLALSYSYDRNLVAFGPYPVDAE